MLASRPCAPGLRRPMCTIGGMRIGASRRPLLVQAVRVPRPSRAAKAAAKPPTAPSAAPSAAAEALFVAEEVVGAEVEVMAPGAVDAGLFEADLSATALLAELEVWTEKLGDVLDAPVAAGTLAGSAAKDAGGDMTRGEHGMFNTNESDKARLREAVDARRQESKAERAVLKAGKMERREERLGALEARREKRAEARAARQATGSAAPAPAAGSSSSGASATTSSSSATAGTANRGGPAGPGPASVAAAPAVDRKRPRTTSVRAAAAPAPVTVDAPAAGAAAAAAPAAVPAAAAPAPAAPQQQQQQEAEAEGGLVPLAKRRLVAAPAPLSLALPPAAPRRAAAGASAADRSQRRASRARAQGAARGAAAAVGALPATPAARRAAAAASALPSDLDSGAAGSAMSGYFQEASRNELLSADQEKELYVLVQEHIKYEDISRDLAASLGRAPSDEEWAAAAGAESVEDFRAAVQAAAAAKQLMVKSNMRLVVSICKKYQNMGMSLSDLVSEGIAGLVRGVEKFDGTKGFKFSTYAHWWIRQGVTRALTDQGRLVRLPVHMQELLSRVQRTSKEMEGQLRRKPTRAEVAAHMGIEQDKLDEMYDYLQAVRSLEGTVGGDADGATLGDTIEDEAALDADEASLMSGLREDMAKLLERLPSRDAAVMRMRYGLDGEAYTLDDIGRILKVTRERVRQIEAKALRALRSNLGTMEASIGEYSGASFDGERLAARTSSGTKKT